MLLNSFFHFTILVFYFFPLFPKTTRTLSDTQPYPNATRTLSDDDLKLSTNRKAPRTMGTQDATNVAAFRSVCCHFKTVVYCYFFKFITLLLNYKNAKRFYLQDILFYHQLGDIIVLHLLPLWHFKWRTNISINRTNLKKRKSNGAYVIWSEKRVET